MKEKLIPHLFEKEWKKWTINLIMSFCFCYILYVLNAKMLIVHFWYGHLMILYDENVIGCWEKNILNYTIFLKNSGSRHIQMNGFGSRTWKKWRLAERSVFLMPESNLSHIWFTNNCLTFIASSLYAECNFRVICFDANQSHCGPLWSSSYLFQQILLGAPNEVFIMKMTIKTMGKTTAKSIQGFNRVIWMGIMK